MKESLIYKLAKLSAGSIDAADAVRAVQSIPAVEWTVLLRAARLHGLTCAIYANISSCDLLGELPGDAANALGRAAFADCALTALLLERHNNIVKAAAHRNVKLLPLKGAYLCGRYYREGTRSMNDLDYLVPAEEAVAAREIMEELGFARMRHARLNPAFAEKYAGEEKFVQRAGGIDIYVEIHTQLLESASLQSAFPLEPAQIFENAHCESGILLPRVEHALLFGALHLAVSHQFARLMWVADTDRLARENSFDWNFLIEEADCAKSRLVLLHVLAAANRLYGTPLPDAVQRAVSRERRMLSPSRVDSWIAAKASPLEIGTIPFLLAKHPLIIVADRLFPSPEFIRLRYGVSAAFVPAWYLARPFSLVASALRSGKRSKSV